MPFEGSLVTYKPHRHLFYGNQPVLLRWTKRPMVANKTKAQPIRMMRTNHQPSLRPHVPLR